MRANLPLPPPPCLVEYDWHVCPICGIQYAAPQYFFAARRDGDQGVTHWFCPNGHHLSFTERDNNKLRRERDRLQQQIARVKEERTDAIAAKKEAEAQLKRTLNRAGAGVCPCCNRTFSRLALHMATKHPGIVPLNNGG